MSSLAAQLASIASLDSHRLKQAKQSSTAASYLFTPTEAAQHDFQTIHSLGSNGFEELKELDGTLEEFEEDVFGEAAKTADRLLLPLEENKRLGLTLDRFLSRLSRHIPLRAAAKVIEWLVRRFRIHEMNVDGVLACFLPYHDSQQFVRILSILRIPANSHLTFLQAPKSAHLPLSRQHLIISLHKDKSLSSLRLVASLLSNAIKSGTVHRTLVGFHASTLVGYLEHGGKNAVLVGDSSLSVLVPEVVEGLKCQEEDIVSANLIVLLALARKATLSPPAIHALLLSILTSAPSDVYLSAGRTANALSTLLGLLQSQEELQEVGKDVVLALERLQDVGVLLAQGSAGYEVSKALRPIIVSLVKNLDVPSASTTLEAFITSPLTPPPTSLISFLTRILLLSDEEASRDKVVRVLAVLKERFAGVWERESLDVLGKVDGEIKVGILSLCDAVAKVDPRGDVTNVFLSLNSADSASRLAAVRTLLEKLENKGDGMDVDEDVELVASAKSNLLLRLSDTYVPVLEAVYGSPSTLLDTVSDARSILDSVLSLVTNPTTSKAVVRTHLAFLAGPFVNRYPEYATEIVQKAFFGFLLVTKPRQVMASNAWEVLAESAALGEHELVKGVAGEVVKKLAVATEEKHRLQAESDEFVVERLAHNVLASSDVSGLVDFLVGQSASADAHARLLATLVLARVVKTSGPAQLSTALQVVEYLNVAKESLAGVDVYVETLLETIVTKPSATKTSQRAKIALLVALQSVEIAEASQVVWLDLQKELSPVAKWATSIYTIVNSAEVPLEVSGPLLRNLFTALRDDTLLFLASIWTAPLDGSAAITGKLQAVALRHAQAFIQAHVIDGGKDSIDFQTVVPALFVALRSPEKVVRDAALACLKLVKDSTQDKAGAPYALESIYGSASESVQLLKGQDLKRYLETLLSDSASLSVDAAHVVSVHQDQMPILKTDAKKDSNYKRGVLCFVLSHVAAWSSTSARIALLETVQAVRDSSRIQILSPLLKEILGQSVAESSEENTKLAQLILDGYDRTASASFEEQPDAWALFKASLTTNAHSTSGRDVRNLALAQLQAVLYSALPAVLKAEVVEVLVQTVLDPEAAHVTDIKACLRALAPSSAIIVALLASIRPATESLRSSKRNKQDAESQAAIVRQFHAGLAVLLESRSVESLEGNLDLLTALLDTLSALLESKTKADVNVDYTEQLLLTGLCSIASKIEGPVADNVPVDVTVVMKVLADTKNPQTFQQALLLISQFSRLAPLVVLQNALPIFVSVGAHTSQRDDAFTFQVVEKTVASILPVMVKSFNDETSDRQQLWTKSLEILQVFIGMSQHVPAHRKTRLFSNLVQVLGPSDFLGPITMLLLNTFAQKPRGRGVDRASAFVLPSSVLNVFDVSTRFSALLDVAVEARSLLDQHIGMPAQPSFLRQTSALPSTSISDDTKVDLRRATTLLAFVQSTCQQLVSVALSEEESIAAQVMVAALLPIGFASQQEIEVEGLEELAQTSQAALDAVIRILSVPAFAASIEPLLAGEDAQLRLGAIALLTSRLPDMKIEARKVIAPVAMRAVAIALDIAKTSTSTTTVMAAFASIAEIAKSATAQEDAGLGPVVAVAIAKGEAGVDNDRLVKRVFVLLAVLSRRLGPRLIPHIKKFTGFTVAVATRLLKLPKPQLALLQESLLPFLVESVATFVAAVPTFLGNNLAQLLVTLLQPALLESADGGKSPSVHALLNSVAKNVPPATAFPAVFQLWKDIDHSSSAPSIAVLDLLKRAIRHTNREVFATQMKPVFNFYLLALDSRWEFRAALSDEEVGAVEAKLVEAFLESVIKMNEASFRPFFVRVFDWAAIELSADESQRDHFVARRITFYHLLEGLFEKFKSIMTPYMATALDNVIESLEGFVAKAETDGRLWLQILVVLQKSFEYDEGTFWSDEQFTKLLPLLVGQIPITFDLSPSSEEDDSPAPAVLCALFGSLAQATSSPSFLKSLNHTVLLQTRSSEPAIRALALRVVAAVWSRKGDDMLELVPQTVSGFVSEALDDVEENVEASARELLVVLEGLVGPLSAYFGDA